MTPIGVNNKPPVATDTNWYTVITDADGGSSEPPVTIATNRIIRGVIGGSDRPSLTIDTDRVISVSSNKPQCGELVSL